MFERIGFGAAQAGDADYDRGVRILQQLSNVMNSMYGDFLPSVADLIAYYNPARVEGLGLAANVGGQSVFTSTAAMSDSETLAAMRAVAIASGGNKVPTMNDLTNALMKRAMEPSAWQQAKYVVGISAGKVVTGLEEIGETAIDAGKISLQTLGYAKYLIYALPFVAVWWLVKNKEALSSTALQVVQKKVQGNPRRRRRRRR